MVATSEEFTVLRTTGGTLASFTLPVAAGPVAVLETVLGVTNVILVTLTAFADLVPTRSTAVDQALGRVARHRALLATTQTVPTRGAVFGTSGNRFRLHPRTLPTLAITAIATVVRAGLFTRRLAIANPISTRTATVRRAVIFVFPWVALSVGTVRKKGILDFADLLHINSVAGNIQ